MNILPDDSAVTLASLSLPEDHWLYKKHDFVEGQIEPAEKPKPFLTRNVADSVTKAAQFAIRRATMCGQEDKFDPDALVQNIVVTFCGERPLKSMESIQPAAADQGESPQDSETPIGTKEHMVEIAEVAVNGILNSTATDEEKRDSLIRLVAAWIDTGNHFAKGQQFYQALIECIGEKLGDATKLCYDGTMSDSVLALRVPEVVAKLQKDLQDLQDKVANALT